MNTIPRERQDIYARYKAAFGGLTLEQKYAEIFAMYEWAVSHKVPVPFAASNVGELKALFVGEVLEGGVA